MFKLMSGINVASLILECLSELKESRFGGIYSYVKAEVAAEKALYIDVEVVSQELKALLRANKVKIRNQQPKEIGFMMKFYSLRNTED